LAFDLRPGLIDAGMLAHEIVLGVAFYGHSFSVPPDTFESGTKTLAAPHTPLSTPRRSPWVMHGLALMMSIFGLN